MLLHAYEVYRFSFSCQHLLPVGRADKKRRQLSVRSLPVSLKLYFLLNVFIFRGIVRKLLKTKEEVPKFFHCVSPKIKVFWSPQYYCENIVKLLWAITRSKKCNNIYSAWSREKSRSVPSIDKVYCGALGLNRSWDLASPAYIYLSSMRSYGFIHAL